MLRSAFLAAALLLLTTVACDQYGELTSPVGQSRIRLINVSPDAPVLSLVRNDSALQSGVAFPGASAYSVIPATRTSQFLITDPLGTAILAVSVNPAVAADYAAVVYGEGTQRAVSALRSETAAPSAGTARLRIVHTAGDMSTVDIYVTDPSADIEQAIPTYADRQYGNVSGYAERVAAFYRIRATAVGTKDVLLDVTAELVSGRNYSGFFVESPGGGEPFSLLLVEDSGS